jgi:hypothetical protein
VRVAAEDLAVLACAGLALVGVNYEVPGSTIVLVSRYVKNCRGKKPTFDGSLEEDIDSPNWKPLRPAVTMGCTGACPDRAE